MPIRLIILRKPAKESLCGSLLHSKFHCIKVNTSLNHYKFIVVPLYIVHLIILCPIKNAYDNLSNVSL